jgi:hypothetical protein
MLFASFFCHPCGAWPHWKLAHRAIQVARADRGHLLSLDRGKDLRGIIHL